MTISKVINWQSSESKKCLLTLELPEGHTPAEPLLKLWPYQLTRSEATDLHEALEHAIDYLTLFAPVTPTPEVKP